MLSWGWSRRPISYLKKTHIPPKTIHIPFQSFWLGRLGFRLGFGVRVRVRGETFRKQRTADRFQVPSSKFLLPPSLPSPSIWVYHLAIPPSRLIPALQSFIPLIISIYSISLQFFTISFFAMSTKLSTQGSLSQFRALQSLLNSSSRAYTFAFSWRIPYPYEFHPTTVVPGHTTILTLSASILPDSELSLVQ